MNTKTQKKRLDLLVVERGLAESRQKAQAMILAGEVSVDGVKAEKAGVQVPEAARLDVTSRLQKYASRGGLKLEGALSDFAVNASGLTCLDLGSSTGGFTDCLLQHGAVRVYAVDVNIGQLAWKLHQDQRVVQIKRNARELRPHEIAEPIDIVVADVSFISVTKILAPAVLAAKPGATFLILIKPQFELRREEIGEGGIVKDPSLHEKAIASVETAAKSHGLEILGVSPSRITGVEGNQEFFLHARKIV
ncbi:MAG TPA: TlyA family RNA methyltransferase [Candidatus Dormibacteraeota bacterium]|nr:TlyA family RNA methyltransferase [Candidatus Dormibacteraeota bacterium]